MKIIEICPVNDNFSALLSQIDQPPEQLFMLGELSDQPMVAIVGTRKFSPYGERATYEIAGELARASITIVSGLAQGIDGIAHRAALDAGGRTVAVLAHGLDRIYPYAHRGLAKRIIANGGALISEYPIGTPALKHHFVLRNRIVTGLCVGTVVIESKAGGGSMLSADYTLKQNRTLMAVPGGIYDEYSSGPNNLIRSGAIPVTSSTEVLQALGMDTRAIPADIISARNPHEARILDFLQRGGPSNTSEALMSHAGLTAAEFASVIGLMEITGKVRNLGAGRWAHR